MNSSKIIGATFTTTAIDKEFWDTWKIAYSEYKPLQAGAIFEARSESDAAAKGKEYSKRKTGFEPMAQDAAGVAKADAK